jgi:hypothetical protein
VSEVDPDALAFLQGLSDDDARDLPFGTGEVSPDHPDGTTSYPETPINLATGLAPSMFAEQLIDQQPQQGPDVVTLVVFVGLAWLLLKGLK